MNEAIIRINNIPVYGFGLLAVIAYLWGSFVFFKKANESHFENRTILDSVVLSAFWGFIVGRIVFAILNMGMFGDHLSRLFLLTNYPGLDRFGVILGIALGLWLCLRKIKVKFMDWFDLTVLGISAGTAIFLAGLAILAFMWQYIVLALVYLIVFIYFWNVEERYRTFAWYRNNKTSARSGFVAGFSISLWGLLFLVEKILTGNYSWTVGLWSGILFVGGLVLVYIRSGRTITEDLKNILKNGKKQ
ncbi:MAG: prolipoprotein diacylglyceryl transferase family protein [Microgenomates group bacterium]